MSACYGGNNIADLGPANIGTGRGVHWCLFQSGSVSSTLSLTHTEKDVHCKEPLIEKRTVGLLDWWSQATRKSSGSVTAENEQLTR